MILCNISVSQGRFQRFTAHEWYCIASLKNLELDESWTLWYCSVMLFDLAWPPHSLASGNGCLGLSCLRQMVAFTNVWLVLHYNIIWYVPNSCLWVMSFFSTIWFSGIGCLCTALAQNYKAEEKIMYFKRKCLCKFICLKTVAWKIFGHLVSHLFT